MLHNRSKGHNLDVVVLLLLHSDSSHPYEGQGRLDALQAFHEALQKVIVKEKSFDKPLVCAL
jgi:hypothetical protein